MRTRCGPGTNACPLRRRYSIDGLSQFSAYWRVTVPLALLGLIGRNSVDRGLLMAAATIMMVPVVALFALVQRSFVGGLTAGAVKG